MSLMRLDEFLAQPQQQTPVMRLDEFIGGPSIAPPFDPMQGDISAGVQPGLPAVDDYFARQAQSMIPVYGQAQSMLNQPVQQPPLSSAERAGLPRMQIRGTNVTEPMTTYDTAIAAAGQATGLPLTEVSDAARAFARGVGLEGVDLAQAGYDMTAQSPEYRFLKERGYDLPAYMKFDPALAAETRERIEAALPTDPGFITDTAETGGRVAPALAATYITKNPAAVFGVSGAAHGRTAAIEQTQQARDAGRTVTPLQEALAKEAYQGLGGALGAAGGSAFGNITPAVIQNVLMRIGLNALIQGGQAGGEVLGQNLIAQQTIDPNRPTGQNVMEAVERGVETGAIFSGTHEGIRAAPSLLRPPPGRPSPFYRDEALLDRLDDQMTQAAREQREGPSEADLAQQSYEQFQRTAPEFQERLDIMAESREAEDAAAAQRAKVLRNPPKQPKTEPYGVQELARPALKAKATPAPDPFTVTSYAPTEPPAPKVDPYPDVQPTLGFSGKRYKELEMQLRTQVSERFGREAGDIDSTTQAVAANRGDLPVGYTMSAERAKELAETLPENDPIRMTLHNLREIEKNPARTDIKPFHTSDYEDGSRVVVNDKEILTIDREEGLVRDGITSEIPEGGMTLYGTKVLPPEYAKPEDMGEGFYVPDGVTTALNEAGVESGRAAEVIKKLIAYHGSPHDFEKFDISKIGTGEGAQAYGHGLYFAGKKGVAQHYADKLGETSRAHNTFDGKRLTPTALKEMATSNDPAARALGNLYGIKPTSQSDLRATDIPVTKEQPNAPAQRPLAQGVQGKLQDAGGGGANAGRGAQGGAEARPQTFTDQSTKGLYGQSLIESSGVGEQKGLFHEPVELPKPQQEQVGSAEANKPGNTGELFGRKRSGVVRLPNVPNSVIEPIRTAGRAVGEAGKYTVNLAVNDMVGRVRSKNTRTARVAATLAEKAIDASKKAAGEIVAERDRAMTIAGGGLNPARHKAIVRLQHNEPVPNSAGAQARFKQAIEGKIPAAQLSKAEAEVIDAIQALTDRTGQGLQQHGVQQFDYSTGQWRPFNYIPGGEVFVRLSSPELMDALMRGKGDLWDAAIQAIADLPANQAAGIDAARVKALFEAKRADLIGEGKQGAFSRINAEFSREIPDVPTHVTVGGVEIPLFETNPYSYARRLSDSYATRVGFVEHFGQETTPNAPLAKFREQYLQENGEAQSLVELTRALNGVSVEPPILDPGSGFAQAMRGLSNIPTIAKSTMLSASAIQNITEPLGNIQAFSEGFDLFRGAAKLVREPRATIAALEALGAVNKNPADLAWNPSRPVGSVARIIREASGRVFGHQFINELQEKLSGAIAMSKVERMQAGKGTSGDIVDLRALGIELNKARNLAAGRGTPEDYAAIVRKAPGALVGSPLAPAEKTRLSHNRIYRAAIAFETYAQMKVRSFVRQLAGYSDIARQTRMGVDDPKLFFAANVKLGRYLAGTTAAGAMGYFLMALMTGGKPGLEIAVNEAKDKPLQFLRDSFLYTLLAGPYGAILRTATGDKAIGESTVRATLPGFLVAEAADAFNGSGSYSGMTPAERGGHFASRLLPVNKIATQGAVAFGFGDPDQQKMDTAIRGYWRWRRDTTPIERMETTNPDQDQQRFRLAMRRAYNQMREGDTEQMQAAMRDAAGVKGADAEKSMRQSILGRRLLDDLKDEQKQALKTRIGEDAYEQIEAHDKLLETWADSIGPRLAKKRREEKAADERREDLPKHITDLLGEKNRLDDLGLRELTDSEKQRRGRLTGLERKYEAWQRAKKNGADKLADQLMADMERMAAEARTATQPQEPRRTTGIPATIPAMR